MFGIVSDESFDEQLNDLNKPKQDRAQVIDIKRGRDRNEIPSELRKVISEESINGTPAKELSEAFGVSESSISAYKNDATSTASYHKSDNELKQHNDVIRDTIISGARSRLLAALETITPEKLADTKVKDAASVAKDMSAIIKNIEPTQSNEKIFNQQIVFYVPKPKSESDFEIIEARD